VRVVVGSEEQGSSDIDKLRGSGSARSWVNVLYETHGRACGRVDGSGEDNQEPDAEPGRGPGSVP